MKISLLFVSTLLVAACGAGSTSGPSREVSPATSPTPDMAALGARYLAIVGPTNTALDALSKALQAKGASAASVRPSAQKVLESEVQQNTALLAFEGQVPASIQPDVRSLRSASAGDIAALQQVVAATSALELNAAVAKLYSSVQASGQAAVLLRSDLGLPPAPLASSSP